MLIVLFCGYLLFADYQCNGRQQNRTGSTVDDWEGAHIARILSKI